MRRQRPRPAFRLVSRASTTHASESVAISTSKRSVLTGAGILAILAIGGFTVIEKNGGLSGTSRPDGAQADEAPASAKHDTNRSKAERSERELQQRADQWYQQILERHPEMAVSFKDVPDDENGFLQLLNFTDRFGKYGSDGLPMPENISAMLNGRAAWDAAVLGKWLEENPALLDEIVAIGLLPAQSVKGIDMDRLKFFSARIPNECSKLLLAHARLAMEQGDEAAALQSTRAALGLADHMDRMELPSLLSETVSVLVRQSTRKAILDQLIVSDGVSAPDFAAWQELLTHARDTPADLAKVFLGEWHHSTRSFLLPGLLGDPDTLPVLVDSSGRAPDSQQKINDPDAVVEAHIAYFSRIISAMRESDLGEIPGLSAIPPEATGLSEGGAALLDTLFKGSTAWSKGWTRSQTDAAIVYAAFQAASGGELPLEPYTDKPFILDREDGTIRVPEDPWFQSMDYKPVKIPVLKQP